MMLDLLKKMCRRRRQSLIDLSLALQNENTTLRAERHRRASSSESIDTPACSQIH